MAEKPFILGSLCDQQYGLPSQYVEEIRKNFELVLVADFESNPSKYAEKIIGILSYHAKPKVTKTLLEKLPNLKVVAVNGVGYNHLDVDLIKSFGVKISNSPGVLDETVADLALALLLTAGRDIYQNIQYAMSPETTRLEENRWSVDVNGTTLGIVGMGRIGFKIAQRAKSFKMEILYHNRNRKSPSDETEINATYYKDLNEMLPLCDYVVVVVCLTPETTKMFGTKQFQLMKKSAIFINVSRGDVVDQDALVKALKENQIRSAALDVTSPEPLPRDHELLKLKNVIITPHQGSATLQTRVQMLRKALNNVTAAVNGNPLPDEIPY